MKDQEAIDILELASAEIKGLRSELNITSPKAEAWNALLQILSLLPKQNQGYSIDVVPQLDICIKELKSADKNVNKKGK